MTRKVTSLELHCVRSQKPVLLNDGDDNSRQSNAQYHPWIPRALQRGSSGDSVRATIYTQSIHLSIRKLSRMIPEVNHLLQDKAYRWHNRLIRTPDTAGV